MLAINEALGNSLGFSVATGASRGVLSQVITGGKYALGGAVAGGAGGAAIAGVGAIPGAIGGGVIGLGVGYTQAKQAKEDFAGDINYIVNNLTLQKIQEAKAAGVTFGALSDTEMRIIGSSADQLASLWDAEKSVFTGSPEEVEKNLKTLYETFESKKISSGLGAEKESAINNAW
jgi:hypothetical protein